MEERNVNVPGVIVILKKENKICLLQRKNTGHADGYYSPIAGHVENGENFTDAIVRETMEEANILLDRKDLKVVHVQHRKSSDTTPDRIYVYFLSTVWKGDLQNMEPDKCDDISWFDIDNLPKNTSPTVKAAIDNIEKEIFYSES